jgi:hypothetical protein
MDEFDALLASKTVFKSEIVLQSITLVPVYQLFNIIDPIIGMGILRNLLSLS